MAKFMVSFPRGDCIAGRQAASGRYIVNGVTGKASGTAPWSWVKITLAVLTAIVLVTIFVALQNG